MSSKEHKKLWWAKMIEKHGSEEAVREFMRERGMAAKRTGRGGFAYLKRMGEEEELKQISRRALEKRWDGRTQD